MASPLHQPFLPYLRQLVEDRSTLSREQARALLASLLHSPDESSELQFAAILGALAARGETAAEIAGFVDAMRAAATPIPLTESERLRLTDTCGTGGDLSGTFNISTAAALVAAAAGASVAKHGNRAVTSQCGSADVLEALGITIQATPAEAAEALRRHRFTFLLAPSLHPAMKRVLPVRRALGVRTVFNVLGPLTNPAGASSQIMGVYAARLVPVVAEAMVLLGVRHAFVVHGETDAGGIDELSISGTSTFAEVRNGVIRHAQVHPEDLGLQASPIAALQGADAAINAAILRAVFAGEQGPRQDIVLLNAAAVLITANLAADLPDGLALARRTIESGAVTALVEALAGQPQEALRG